MSWDLLVATQDRPLPDAWAAAARGRLLTVHGPDPVDPELEDLPDRLAAQAPAARFVVSVSVPAAGTDDDRESASAIAQALADRFRGVVYDPQADAVVWPLDAAPIAPRRPRRRALGTSFCLRPGPLDAGRVRALLALALGTWELRPRRYGANDGDETAGATDVDTLVAFYARRQRLLVEGAGGTLYFLPDRDGERSPFGTVSWWLPRSASLSAERARRHLDACREAFALLDAPYAHAGWDEDASRKKRRIVERDLRLINPQAPPGATYKEEVATVGSYRDGLAALFWRNLFGRELAALFGERLRSLSGDQAWELDRGGWMIQPYAHPDDAFTATGVQREREIIAHLGADCFFDFAHQQPPRRAPLFSDDC